MSLPTVSVLIPAYNGADLIEETLASLSTQTLTDWEAIVVDDCSTDDSYDIARELARSSGGRLRVIRNLVNLGKRRSINRAVRESTAEVIVSVDSDVVVDANAIHQLVRRFTDPRIKAVGGWVDVRNKHDNWLTRMQVVKYWYGYFFLKNLEWGFKRVMCLSGCLTAYQRSVSMMVKTGLPVVANSPVAVSSAVICPSQGARTTVSLRSRCASARVARADSTWASSGLVLVTCWRAPRACWTALSSVAAAVRWAARPGSIC